ncbi:Class III signal peptide [Methanobrevibacter millerae]|uniref:Class III signal peptide n=2 Tax=Methanobrevibacter millerae TaxID=230361 RepID=A0A1G5UWH5_9EURY|nr:Class III signal peptide [Methanobrevibacter millerae]
MFRKIDNKGQSSAELILIIGGLLVVVLFVGSYISSITGTTQSSFKTLLSQEREKLINKI